MALTNENTAGDNDTSSSKHPGSFMENQAMLKKLKTKALIAFEKQQKGTVKALKDQEFHDVLESAVALCSHRLDNVNLFHNIPHPWKVLCDSVTPTKKPLTKREKDAAKEFDIGKVNVKAWRQSCLESEDKKRNTITKATINRVSFAIISLFSQKLYALAFSSEMPMSDRGWVQSKKGAKPKQSGEASNIKALCDYIMRDHHMAWQALKLCPLFQSAVHNDKVILVTAILKIYNERLCELLFKDHGLDQSACGDMYCVRTDHFLQFNMQMDDSSNISHLYPFPEERYDEDVGEEEIQDNGEEIKDDEEEEIEDDKEEIEDGEEQIKDGEEKIEKENVKEIAVHLREVKPNDTEDSYAGAPTGENAAMNTKVSLDSGEATATDSQLPQLPGEEAAQSSDSILSKDVIESKEHVYSGEKNAESTLLSSNVPTIGEMEDQESNTSEKGVVDLEGFSQHRE